MAGRHLCSHRYNEFVELHNNLKREFIGFNFPKLPGKWPFALSEQQIDSRRRGLEQYLEKVCAIRVIAESDLIQEFLTESNEENCGLLNVEIKVLLPSREVVTVGVSRNATADIVFEAVMRKVGLGGKAWQAFSLFEIMEYNFERKLQPGEIPHSIYIQNYTTAAATCLIIKRWLFSISEEIALCHNDQIATLFFHQAIDDVNRGFIYAGERLYQLKVLQDPGRKHDYLALARELPGYGEIIFPHCGCDSRKDGHVIPSIGLQQFRLRACSEDGTPESQIIEFPWDIVTSWEIDEEGMAFCLQYKKPEKNPRWIRIHTPYYVFLSECCDKVYQERRSQEEVG
ncbi:hypothetical protein QYM36_005951 [Artemia franciscana]|nr:hypothetical protein QYM36_005951 [Artemia franciscana]